MINDNVQKELGLAPKATFITKFGATYSLICTILLDIFKTVCNATLYVLCASLLLLFLICIIWGLQFISHKFKSFNQNLCKKTDNRWFVCIFCANLLFTIILSIGYYYNHDKPNGYLSENSDLVKALQNDIILIKNKLETLLVKSDNIERISENTLNNTSRIIEYQKETNDLLKESNSPSDPRKVLAQYGIAYTGENFINKILEGDIRTLDLFYKAGMPVDIAYQNGTNPFFTIISKNINNASEIIEQAIAYGFDPNKRYKININNELNKPFSQVILSLFPKNEKLLINIDSIVQDEYDINLGDFIVISKFIYTDFDFNIVKKFNLNISNGIFIKDKILNNIFKVAKQNADKITYISESINNMCNIFNSINCKTVNDDSKKNVFSECSKYGPFLYNINQNQTSYTDNSISLGAGVYIGRSLDHTPSPAYNMCMRGSGYLEVIESHCFSIEKYNNSPIYHNNENEQYEIRKIKSILKETKLQCDLEKKKASTMYANLFVQDFNDRISMYYNEFKKIKNLSRKDN